MSDIMVEDLVVPEEWIIKHQKASFEESQDKKIDNHNLKETESFLVDYFKRNPMIEAIEREPLVLDSDKIISVKDINCTACPFPCAIMPDCWQTEIMYDDGKKENHFRCIRVDASVEEINMLREKFSAKH